MKRIILLLTLTMLTACNTMQGVGRDMESAGETLSDSAKKVRDSF